MFTGAQRVKLPSDGKGVTLYLYWHGGTLPRKSSHMLGDVRWISQFAPGQLVRQRSEGKEGGRRVVSYLEASLADTTDQLHHIRTLLDLLKQRVESGLKGPYREKERGAEFFASSEFPAEERIAEFDSLRKELESFLAEGFVGPPKRNLIIRLTSTPGGPSLAWDQSSQTILSPYAPDWKPMPLQISNEVLDAFESMHGVFWPHAVDLLKPAGEIDLAALGGVQVVDISGKVLWFSPEPEKED